MTRSRLLLAVAAVLAGTTVLLGVLGVVVNPILLVLSLPFGLATYQLWLHATGRLEARVQRRAVAPNWGRPPRDATSRSAGRATWRRPWSAVDEPTGTGATRSTEAGGASSRRGPASSGRRRASMGRDDPRMGREEALSVLGLDRGGDERAIRRAYRERAKAVHPDADGGDEAAFRRVTAAYERLRRPRGKG